MRKPKHHDAPALFDLMELEAQEQSSATVWTCADEPTGGDAEETFCSFFFETTGHAPFLWQKKLVKRVLSGDENAWHFGLGLPPGCGKTSLLHISAFCMAWEFAHPDLPRRTPRRIVYIVDRRLLVDDISATAGRIADWFQRPLDGSWRDGLRTPLMREIQATRLRGGETTDEKWSLDPWRPMLITSTVDQAGSRLLFDGYGLSWKSKVNQAGLFGTDAMFLVDEAHLCLPFLRTLMWVREMHLAHETVGLGEGGFKHPFEVVPFTGTFGQGDASTTVVMAQVGDLLRLAPGPDSGNDETLLPYTQDEAVAKRATKRLNVIVTTAPTRKEKVAQLTKLALEAISSTDIKNPRVVVFANTVATAREVHAGLASAIKKLFAKADLKPALTLVIGRQRPWLKKRVEAALVDARPGAISSAPMLVVTTQCLEVGVDVSFDAGISEAASVEALLQRMGRVDRLGEQFASGATATFQVVGVDGKDGVDPVYGTTALEFIKWARFVQAEIGGEEICKAMVDGLAQGRMQANDSPSLLPDFVRQLAWTNARSGIEAGPFLRGFTKDAPEVYCVWRSDIHPEMNDKELRPILEALPIHPDEVLTVPLWMAASITNRNQNLSTVLKGLGDQEGIGLEVKKQKSSEDDEGDAENVIVPEVDSDEDEEPTLNGESGWLHTKGFNDPINPCFEPGGFILRFVKDRVELQIIRLKDGSNPICPGDTLLLTPYTGGCDEFGLKAPTPKTKDAPVADLGGCGMLPQAVRKCCIRMGAPYLFRLANIITTFPVEKENPAEHLLGLAKAVEAVKEAFDGEIEDDNIPERNLVSVAEALIDLLHGFVNSTSALVVSDDDNEFNLWLRAARKFAELSKVAGRIRIKAVAYGGTSHGWALTVEEVKSTRGTPTPVGLHEHLQHVAEAAKRNGEACGLSKDLINALGRGGANHDLGKATVEMQRALSESKGFGVLRRAPSLTSRGVLAKSGHTRKVSLSHRHEIISAILAAKAGEAMPEVLHLIASHHGYGRPFPALSREWEAKDDITLVTGESLNGETITKEVRSCLTRFNVLSDRYGHWRLAYLECLLRTADWSVSAAQLGGEA